MRYLDERNFVLLLTLFLVACGGPPDSKNAAENSETNSATNGSTNASTNASTNHGTGNAGTNNASTNGLTNNTSGPTNGSTNGVTNGGTCEILTSESREDYCNLQATCEEGSLLVECLLDEVWTCFCGMESVELDENPCDDPDVFAPQLAEVCPTGE